MEMIQDGVRKRKPRFRHMREPMVKFSVGFPESFANRVYALAAHRRDPVTEVIRAAMEKELEGHASNPQ